MKNSRTVFRYELFNAVRSKWLYVYTLLLAGCTFGLVYLAEDERRAQLSLINVLVVIVPLVSVLFTTTYWYNAERFTELLLSQPVSRTRLFWSRIAAICGSLSLSLFLGLVLTSILAGKGGSGLYWLFLTSAVSGGVFCLLGAWIAVRIHDRMWGIGLGLAVWFYFTALHDAFLLLILYWFREYPLEYLSSLLCGLNPVGLMRVTLLMHFDAPLLLGHSGALVRRLVETGNGFRYALIIALCWLAVPALLSRREFLRRDF